MRQNLRDVEEVVRLSRCRGAGASPWLRTALAVTTLVVLAACRPDKAPAGPTPIEALLAQDSAFRAIAGDSANQHIGFDYEDLNRERWQKPELVLGTFGDLRGRTVVEVGSGTGFFTRRLARRGARVLALDISPEVLVELDSLNAAELDAATAARIDATLVPADDPSLDPGEADAALLVNTFMYIRDGGDYLRKLRRGLTPGAPIVIVDFKGVETPVGPPVASRMPASEVAAALRAAGFRNVAVDEDLLDYQYVVTAVAP